MRNSGDKSVRVLVLLGTLAVILAPTVFADDVSPQVPTVPKVEPSTASDVPAEAPTNQTSVETLKPATVEPVKEKAVVASKAKLTATKTKSVPTSSAFVNSFLNPPTSSTPATQNKSKAAQANRTTQSRGVVPAYSYGTTQRSFGTYSYAGGNNNRFNSGFANNGGFQSGNNARPGSISIPRLGSVSPANSSLFGGPNSLGQQLMRDRQKQNENYERIRKQYSK